MPFVDVIHLPITGPEQRDALKHGGGALWSGTNKNRNVSTGPLASPFARGESELLMSQNNLVLSYSAVVVEEGEEEKEQEEKEEAIG